MTCPKFIEDFLFWVFIRLGAWFFPCISIYVPDGEGGNVECIHFAINPQTLARAARDLDENSLK